MDIEKRVRRGRTLNSVTEEGAGDGKQRGFVKCETECGGEIKAGGQRWKGEWSNMRMKSKR